MTSIRLSVVIPNFNHGHFLKERVLSILAQLSEQDEILVVDDASTDESVSIIASLTEQDERIRCIRNARNQGTMLTANVGMRAARGTYLTWLAADDVLLPGFVEKTITMLQEHPDIGVACSDFVFSLEGIISAKPLIPSVTAPVLFRQKETIKMFWETEFWIPGHTAICKTELALKYGGLQNDFGPYSDWFLFHTIAFLHGVAYLPLSLSIMKQSPTTYSHQVTRNKRKSWKYQTEILDFLGEPRNRALKRLFKASGVVRTMVRPQFLRFLLYPRYWNFFLVFVHKSFLSLCKRLHR